ncbi:MULTISPECIES: ABC transporter ATP-binding protein [unclassified Methylobacterium]|uniref:ABC transporter ATP-binding protein n=1 Tax=unclassified Methylobacterium TaxID=2615210 RepID=UPI0036F53BCD
MSATDIPAGARPIIDIRGLSLAYERDGRRTEILSSLDLAVPRGQFLVIVGESGVGKSTLLRVLIDLAKPSGGTVTLDTKAATRTPMALVFQDARLLPWRRVIDNVAFGLERHGLPKSERRARASAMLKLVGLADLAGRWPHQLSGGQRQRVAIARALAVEPEVLLMDEPFSALDSFTREGLQDEVQRIKAQTGKTVLFVTHDIDEAVYLADRVVVLAGSPGRIAADVAIDLPRPRQRRDATLIEAARHLRAELSRRSAEL